MTGMFKYIIFFYQLASSACTCDVLLNATAVTIANYLVSSFRKFRELCTKSMQSVTITDKRNVSVVPYRSALPLALPLMSILKSKDVPCPY